LTFGRLIFGTTTLGAATRGALTFGALTRGAVALGVVTFGVLIRGFTTLEITLGPATDVPPGFGRLTCGLVATEGIVPDRGATLPRNWGTPPTDAGDLTPVAVVLPTLVGFTAATAPDGDVFGVTLRRTPGAPDEARGVDG